MKQDISNRREFNRSKSNRRGFVLMMAVVLVGLIGLGIAGIAQVCRIDMVRTRARAQDAQLRELLLAGADVAIARLANGSAVDGMITLPDDLTAQGAKIVLHAQAAAGADAKEVTIEASFSMHQLSQDLHFVRSQGAWQLNSAELGS